MIAEHIQRQGESSFKRLAAYVTDEPNQGRGDPSAWRLADYIFDKDHAGAKVASIRVTNCVAKDPGWAVKECCVLSDRNTRSKKDKAYHLVVSFPEGERPTAEQILDIEDELVRSIGFEDHKRISAIHQNTDNWHLHVAICTVHPVTFRNVTPFYDHFRMQEMCQELELKHGLQRVNHSPTPERPLNGKAGEIRAHAEQMAFAKWIEQHAGEKIREAAAKAKTWTEVHNALAPYGLVIKPRGAGLVIAHHANDKIRIKASEVGREMSIKPLVQRLGPYETPAETLEAQEEYVSQVPDPTPETETLWDRYKAQQTGVIAAKTLAMVELRQKHDDEWREMSEFHEWRWGNLCAQDLIWANRLRSQRELAADKKADREKLRARQIEERTELKAKYKTVAWPDYLGFEAGSGNRAALDIIERKMREEAIELAAVERNIRTVTERGRGLGR